MAASNERARNNGFVTPASTDPIRNGDNAIAQNARATIDLHDRAVTIIDQWTVTATTLAYGEDATATTTGTLGNKIINIGIPKGMTDDAAAQILLAAQSAETASVQAAADAQQAEQTAAQMQASQLEIPDQTIAAALGNELTQSALAFTQRLPWIDPHMEHGTTGDGTTDDTTSLQAALTAAGTTKRKSVRLRRGATYRLGTHLNVPEGVHLDGQGATIKVLAASTMRALQVTGSQVLVSDLHIDMNSAETVNGGANTNQQGVMVNAASASIAGVTLRRVHVVNSHQRGIVAQSSGVYTITDITVEDCTVADVAGRAIHIGGTGAATNRGIRVTGCRTIRPGEYGIICQGVGDAHVDKCEVIGEGIAGNSGVVMSATNAASLDWSVTNCTVSGFHAAGRWGIIATWGAERFTISGNIVTDCYGGIAVDPERGSEVGVEVNVAATINGNTIRSTTGGLGMNLRMCNGLTVTGNTVEDVPVDRGIAIASATGITIAGNTVTRTGNDGIGIFGTASGGGHTIGPNTVRDWGLETPSALPVRNSATPLPSQFVTTQTTP